MTTWGESHGAGHRRRGRRLPAAAAARPRPTSRPDLDRRAPGQSALVTQRKESDTVQHPLRRLRRARRSARRSASHIPNAGHAARATTARCRRSTGRATPTTRYEAEVRHPRLARRRPHERARDGRPRRGGRDRAQAARASAGASSVVAWVSKVRHARASSSDVERVTRDAGRSRRRSAAPIPAMAEQMIAAVEAAREGRRLAGRRRHLRRARLPAGLGRAGVRSARGRSRQGR